MLPSNDLDPIIYLSTSLMVEPFSIIFFFLQMDEYWASWKTMSETELHKLGIFEVKDSECAPNTPDR